MMPAANQGVGMNMGFPDVCTTPMAPAPVPIPYPNIGMNAMAMPFVPNIMVSMAPAHNMGAKPLLTNGDNAGVAHPLFMQPGGTTMGNPRILLGGMPAAHLAVPTYGNNFNNPVGSKLVPSVTNVLLGSGAVLDAAHRAVAASRLMHEHGGAHRTDDGVLLVALPCISLRSDRWLAAQLRAAPRPLAGVVLDLRGNPGGAVAVAVRITAQLLALDVPLTVAIDGDTASAAELLAALLQHHGAATLCGRRSFGKGEARPFAVTGHDLAPRGRAMRMRAAGRDFDGSGLRPDEPCAAAAALGVALANLRRVRSARR